MLPQSWKRRATPQKPRHAKSIHAKPQQPRPGRLAIARLPPCSPGCRPDLPCYRRRLAARRAGLPPRPARTPAPKSPADAQLPPPQMQRHRKHGKASTNRRSQTRRSANAPLLAPAVLRNHRRSYTPRSKVRAAPRACSGASARGGLHAVGCGTPHVPRSPARSLRPLIALDTFVAARCAALGRPAAARLRTFAYSGGPLTHCIGFPSHLRAGHVGRPAAARLRTFAYSGGPLTHCIGFPSHPRAGHVGSPPPRIERGVRLMGTRHRRTVR